jgi:hypothetical protein
LRILERERADALLDVRPVRRVPEVSDAPPQDDDTTFSALIGMLVGVVVCLPLWAAVAVAVILILR